MVDLTKPIGKCTAQELAAAILLNAGPGRFNPTFRTHNCHKNGCGCPRGGLVAQLAVELSNNT